MSPRSHHHLRRALLAATAATLVAGLAATLVDLGGHRVAWENVHWTAAAVLAALLARAGVDAADARDRRARQLIAAGLLAWLLGQVAWDVQSVSGVVIAPAPSDVLYLVSGVTIGSALFIGIGRSVDDPKAVYLDCATAFFALAAAVTGLTGAQLAWAPLIAALAAAVFPIAFLGTASAAVIAAVSRQPAWLPRWNVAFLVALGTLGVAWLLWLPEAVGASYTAGAPSGYLFSAALAGAGYAAARWSSARDLGPEAAAAPANRIASLIPVPAVVISLATLVLTTGGNPLSVLAHACAGTAIVLAMIRQTLLLRERESFVVRDRERLAHQRRLLALNEQLLRTSSADTVLESIADALRTVVAYDTLTIYLADREAGTLVPVLVRDRYADAILRNPLPFGTGITGDAVARGEATLVNDAGNDPRASQVPGTPTVRESLIVAPLLAQEGPLGALNLYREGRDFQPADLELARLYASQAAIALETAHRHGLLSRAARTDSLTGLLNRAAFVRVADDLLARQEPGTVAVLFLDLDGFKLVNDSLGHGAGDALLRAAADRLRAALRPDDAVARVGGDEFAVVTVIRDVSEAEGIARRLLDHLRPPFRLDSAEILVRGSIGISTSDFGRDREALLSHADAAMYEAKARGKDRYEVFRPEFHDRAVARLALERDLRYALERDEFVVHFQPVVDLGTGRVVGHEALVRWQHPSQGLVLPGGFIAASEETGLIVPIGRRVLQLGLSTLARWTVEGWTGWLSVNLAPRQLVEPDVVERVTDALGRAGIPASRLHLEVTESAAIASDGRAVAALHELAGKGVHVVLDDFGTGYSSLERAAQLPVSALKIDRSFVAGLGLDRTRAAIAEATVAFGHALGVRVIGEGIETAAQEAALTALGCDMGQGFRYGRAQPGHEGPPGVQDAEPESVADVA